MLNILGKTSYLKVLTVELQYTEYCTLYSSLFVFPSVIFILFYLFPPPPLYNKEMSRIFSAMTHPPPSDFPPSGGIFLEKW